MFKRFKKIFSNESLLDAAYRTTLLMLQYDYQMFEASTHALRSTSSAELPFDVRRMDRRINKYEREVRRNVLTHLTVAGTRNLAPGLALVSIVIDVERIGDYTKNIADLAAQYEKKLSGGPWEQTLVEIEGLISRNFDAAIQVLQNHDEERGRFVMKMEPHISGSTEGIVRDLLGPKASGLTVSESVALALYSRHLKRINAHLTNLSSAIVNPFPRIGFREKGSETGLDAEDVPGDDEDDSAGSA